MKAERSRHFCIMLGFVASACTWTPLYGAPADETTVAEVVITGSLLPTASTTAAPVSLLTRRDLDRGSPDSLVQVLQSLPMVTGTASNSEVDSSLGAARVNMRGLGADRTLVLLNGRRLPSGGIGGDAAVDLNSLPMSMIDRVEILASGASASYGSDAIGGVVNVITRGTSGVANVGGSVRLTEQGGGQVARANAALSVAPWGGSWNVGIDVVRQNGLTDDRRAYSAEPLRIIDADGNLGRAGQIGIPDGVFFVPEDNALGLAPGRYIRVPGSTGQAAANYRLFTREDSYSVAPYNYSQSPNDRSSFWLLGEQPLDEQTQLFVEGLFNHRESSQSAAPEQYATIFDSSPMLSDGSDGIPANNFYNPFGTDLPFAARRIVEGGPRVVSEKINVWRLLVGLKGDRDRWHWELAAAVARSSSTTRSSNEFAGSLYPNALGPSGRDASGQIVCGAPDPSTGIVASANIIAGCVPLDIFDGAGSITQQQVNYMSPRTIEDTGTNGQDLFQALIRGPCARMPAHEINCAFGVDYRRETGSLVADPLHALNFQGLVNPDLPAGAFDTQEVFGELQLPWAHVQAQADSFVSVGMRLSRYSTFGNHASWSAGMVWQATSALKLRGNFATVFRAPQLEELYQARTIDSGFARDPCGDRPTAEQRVHCAASGVPGGSYVQQPTEFGVINGGNPELQPETGNTFGAGAVYTPTRARALQISIDYFRIKLEGVVGAADLDVLLADCADRGTTDSCGAIRRLADGSIKRVATLNRNLGERRVDGLDFAVDWHRGEGTTLFSAQLQATYLRRWDERPYAGGTALHQAGRVDAGPLPRWRANAHLDWHRNHWLLGYSAEYIGGMTEEVDDFPPLAIFFANYDRHVSGMLYHDVDLGYEFLNHTSLLATVANVGDKDPPFLNTGEPENTDPGTYRLLGRSYSLMVNHRF